MLFEKLSYQDDFPINITIASIEEYPIHFHQDIEFLYVLKGKIDLKNGYCVYTLHEGDIFVNAGHEVHSMQSVDDEENIVALIQISTRYFSQYFPNLGKACYRTYSKKATNSRLDTLREMLLQIILQYNIRSFNYKNECIRLMKEVIDCLDRYFNLFAFEGDMAINMESVDQISIDRISRIINYIYQNYSEKIRLEELASMEHLSMFYVSHIIKNCTGKNFREFLCFARAERSEILLLDTNKKISQIAKEVGFSTTAYYEKYFMKWFKRTPEDHRAHYQTLVKSETHPEKITLIQPSQAIYLIKNTLSALNSQDSNASISRLSLEIDVNEKDRDPEPSRPFYHTLEIQITTDDYRALGAGLIHLLDQLKPAKISLLNSESDRDEDVSALYSCLRDTGYYVIRSPLSGDARQVISYGNDSIAKPINILDETILSGDTEISMRLRDHGDGGRRLLYGQSGVITHNGIKKPSYYAYLLLSRLRGHIVAHDKYYCVIRADENPPRYFVITYNYNDEIYNMCKSSASIYQAKSILDNFNDEADFLFNIDIPPGTYSVMKYGLHQSNNIFSYYSALSFSDDSRFWHDFSNLFPTNPLLDIYQEEVSDGFHLSMALQGADIQLAVISPMEGTEQDV